MKKSESFLYYYFMLLVNLQSTSYIRKNSVYLTSAYVRKKGVQYEQKEI